MGDPLHKALLRRFKRPIKVAIFALFLHMVIWIAVSVLVMKIDPQAYKKVTAGITRHPFGWFQWVLVAPTVWFYYVWLYSGILGVVDKLRLNNVIESKYSASIKSEAHNSGHQIQPESNLQVILQRNLWNYLSIIAAVIAAFAQYFVIRPSEIQMGLIPVWYATQWSAFLIPPITAFNVYICAQFVFRAVASSFELRSFFQNAQLQNVFLLHPDGGGGLGELGRYGMKLAGFAVMIGFWALGLTFSPILIGGDPNTNPIVIFLYGLYIILVPLTLLLIILPARSAMKRFKRNKLQMLSQEIQDLLDSALKKVNVDPEEAAKEIKELKELRDLYNVTKTIPEWPIHNPELRLFSGVAIWPAIGAINTIIRLVSDWPL